MGLAETDGATGDRRRTETAESISTARPPPSAPQNRRLISVRGNPGWIRLRGDRRSNAPGSTVWPASESFDWIDRVE